jgi:tetracycline repressor-like protein
VRSWRTTLVREIGIAIEAGDLPSDSDPEQIAFALEALGSGTNPARQLQGDATASERCLRAMHTMLGQPTARAVG